MVTSFMVLFLCKPLSVQQPFAKPLWQSDLFRVPDPLGWLELSAGRFGDSGFAFGCACHKHLAASDLSRQ